jgi:hypothetical protein
MTNLLLSSVVALALILGTSAAFAQGTGMKGGEASTAAAPKADSATPKAEGAAPTNSPAKGSAAETAPAVGAKTGTIAQGESKGSKAANDMKGDTKPSSAATTPPTNSAAKDAKNPSADSKAAGTDTKAGSSTTGNASATAAPPAEKRTQITTAIKQEKVEEVTNVNFNISIGATIPSSVHYHALPPRIVEIYPEWRGYDFIVVRGKYIILRPQTHEIVYIIEG